MYINIEQITNDRFHARARQYSAEFQQGFRCMLLWHAHGVKTITPYTLGTAQADAFIAGCHDAKATLQTLEQAHTQQAARLH